MLPVRTLSQARELTTQRYKLFAHLNMESVKLEIIDTFPHLTKFKLSKNVALNFFLLTGYLKVEEFLNLILGKRW